MRELELTVRTIYAQLVQQVLDGEFTEEFPENGSLVSRVINGRAYWYYNGYDKLTGSRYQKYVGRADNPDVAQRVERFNNLKTDFQARRQMISALRGAGVPAPDPFVSDIVAALQRAGAFRLRCVLVGTVAYQCYPAMLGVILRSDITNDADLAQFHSVSVGIGADEQIPSITAALRDADPTFREVTHRNDPTKVIAVENSRRFRVEFLTPNRSKDEYQDQPAEMPALGSHIGAVPLRYLDYLIHNPVRAVLLHGAGVPVTVPRPERYAIHKLIVATQRVQVGDYGVKRDKDISQAADIITALRLTRRWIELAEAWMEAWGRGPSWREALRKGSGMLPEKARELLTDTMARAARDMRFNPTDYGF